MCDFDAKANNFMQGFMVLGLMRKLAPLTGFTEIDTCLIQPCVLKYLQERKFWGENLA